MMWTIRQRSDFGALRAIRRGAGPQALLLHGVGLRAEAWNAQIDALARHFAVIAPDMPGHGESPHLTGPPTLAAYTDRLAEALASPALIAGHSMGAMIALDLAIRYPSIAHGVAALNAIYRRSPAAATAVRARAAALDGRADVDPSGPLARWFGGQASDEADACRHWLTATDPAGYRDAYRVFAQEDGPRAADLGNLTCPALFVTGAKEPNATPAMSETMAALAPMGRSRVLADAAHMMPMTHAADVSTALGDFFRRCAS